MEPEIRRFPVDHSASSNFMYLSAKVCQVFPTLARAKFDIRWKDSENDYVAISSDDELVEALSGASDDGIQRLYIRILKTASETTEPDGKADQTTVVHPNVTCDGCEGPVRGKRYKCVTCPDYDLCETCEGKNLHPEHNLLRITAPRSDWRAHVPPPPCYQMFGACPPPQGSHGFPPGAPGYPPHHGGPFGPGHHGGPFGFPFGMRGGPHWMRRCNRRAEGCHFEQDHSEAKKPKADEKAADGAEQTKTDNPEQKPADRDSPTEEYLRCIGSSVAALLDPLGIDVEVDVEHKGQTRRCNKTDCGWGGDASASGCPADVRKESNAASSIHQDDVEMANKETGEKMPQKKEGSPHGSPSRNNDGGESDWTMLGSDGLANLCEAGVAAIGHIGQALQLSAEQRFNKQIEECVVQMKAMGFGDEDGWLTRLVTSKNGNMEKVLDALQPHKE